MQTARATTPPGRFENGPPTSGEALVRAFHDCNAMASLGDVSAPVYSARRFVNLQSKQRRNDPIDQNILPMKAIREECVIDQHYLGDCGVESQIKQGEFVDRIGNRFEVWESELPPPDKDYRSTAAAGSHRNLERCQGGNAYFHDRPKKEVHHVTNPAEPRGDDQRQATRQSAMELGGRQTFFNQAGTQHVAEMDTGRETYDGYNIRAPNETRVGPLEPCWRATQSKEHVKAGAAPVPRGGLDVSVPSKRSEVGGVFQRRPAVSAAAATHVRALPIVSGATLRCQASGVGPRNPQGNDLSGARADVEHEGRPEAAAPLPKAPAIESTQRANPSVVPRQGEHPMPAPSNANGPQQFANVTANESREVHRENGMIAPAPSKEPDAARRIVEAIERDAEDDKEVAQITAVFVESVAQVAPREAVDQHGSDVKAYSNLAPQHTVVAAPTHSEETTRYGRDAVLHDHAAADQTVNRANPREEVAVNGTDARIVNIERVDALFESSAQHSTQTIFDNARQQAGKMQTGQRVVGKQIRHDPTLSVERSLGAEHPRPHRSYGGRTNVDHDSLPVVDRTSVADRPRPHQSYGGRTHVDHDSLPVADRASVAIHGNYDRQNDTAVVAPTVALRPAEAWSEHYGLAETRTSQRVAMGEDGVGRAMFGTFDPARPSNTQRTAPRATPHERASFSGVIKNARLDGRSLQGGDEDFIRPRSAAGNDRSLVMRAPTPVGVTNARMTPTVRVDSRRNTAISR